LEGRIINSLGVLAMRDKAYQDAQACFDEYYGIAKELNDKYSQAIALLNFGDLAWRKGLLASQTGDEDSAKRLLGTAKAHLHEALKLSNDNGIKSHAATAEQTLADVEIAEGKYIDAGERLITGLNIVMGSHELLKIRSHLGSVARLLYSQGKIVDSFRFASFVALESIMSGFVQELMNDIIADIRSKISSHDIDVIETEIKTQNLETLAKQAIEILKSQKSENT